MSYIKDLRKYVGHNPILTAGACYIYYYYAIRFFIRKITIKFV